ncbi:cathepsin G-like [Planococcus citri]|uniref:cathepsin G-like n=1 Tax=Planococcus citri TaxID=170843 RepID=UPI0031F98232
MIVFPRILLCALFIIKVTISYKERAGKIESKCKEYVKYACDNPPASATSTSKTPPKLDGIINGVTTSLEMLPHMAFVKLFRKVDRESEGIWVKDCSGTLISDNFILSAAHCSHDVVRDDPGIFGQVKLGSASKSFMDRTGALYEVIEMYVHPNYSPTDQQNRNDVLLLKLHRKVKFSPYTRPICLNTEFPNNLRKAIVSGWGEDENGNFPEYLKSASVYIDDEIVKLKCNVALESRSFNSTTEICGGHPIDITGTSTGDSGGPMQIPMNTGCPNTYEQICISARGSKDFKSPMKVNIFTKVELHLPWIESIVWPDE